MDNKDKALKRLEWEIHQANISARSTPQDNHKSHFRGMIYFMLLAGAASILLGYYATKSVILEARLNNTSNTQQTSPTPIYTQYQIIPSEAAHPINQCNGVIMQIDGYTECLPLPPI